MEVINQLILRVGVYQTKIDSICYDVKLWLDYCTAPASAKEFIVDLIVNPSGHRCAAYMIRFGINRRYQTYGYVMSNQ